VQWWVPEPDTDFADVLLGRNYDRTDYLRVEARRFKRRDRDSLNCWVLYYRISGVGGEFPPHPTPEPNLLDRTALPERSHDGQHLLADCLAQNRIGSVEAFCPRPPAVHSKSHAGCGILLRYLENRRDQVVAGGRFQRGISGNPGGRPKEVGHVRELA
jgi:hypothetical protein